ncbi:caspase-6-like [Brevipalpus obovatus]|uniref:caspase-6-like n=1 Tax=Brevipalpus obovatus TaxID=246614 RepID=UPI003D9EA27A
MNFTPKKVEILKSTEEIDAKLHEIWTSSTSFKNHQSYSPSELDYPMIHTPRGICLIFNHRIFDSQELEERVKTGLDAHALGVAFGYLGFQVRRFDDMMKQQIMDTLESTADEDHLSHDAFICVFLTHGQGSSLWARDEMFNIASAFKKFGDAGCPILRGKPKVFLIQADRRRGMRSFNIQWGGVYGIDFHIIFSCAPVHLNEQKNSLYMQAFSQSLLFYGRHCALYYITQEASGLIRSYLKSKNIPDEEINRCETGSISICQLRTHLFFFPENVYGKSAITRSIYGPLRPSI